MSVSVTGQRRWAEFCILVSLLVCCKERQREPREGGGWDCGWFVG